MKKLLPLLMILLFIDFNALSQELQNDSRWISASSGLRMRDQPDLSGKKLDVIPYGKRVDFISEKDEELFLAGTNGKWTKVKWEGTVGWVYGGFLSGLNPENALYINDNLNALCLDKWGTNLSLCRVELEGYGFTLQQDGSINSGDYEYDLTETYKYEKGISIGINEGYEWGSTDYEFDAELYSLDEIFKFACTIYGDQYKKYLENGQLILPTSTENWSRDNADGYTVEMFRSEIIDGSFESFRIEEEEGCGKWWYFLIVEGLIRFGNGGGC